MFYAYKILKAFVMPPGLLVILFLVLSLALRGRLRILGILSALGTYLISIGPTGDFLRKLTIYRDELPAECDLIVVFGAGASYESMARALEACELSRQMSCPIAVSGYGLETHIMVETLRQVGCRAYLVDDMSRNTLENSEFVKSLGPRTTIIVTSDYHTRRVKFLNPTSKVHALSLPTPSSFLQWFPSYSNFYTNMKLLNEVLGLSWYYLTMSIMNLPTFRM